MCTNLTDALMEDLIEITWTFDRLISEGKIKSWNELMEYVPTGSDGIKMEEATESENMISAEKLINKFTDMANRGTLLCGRNVTQEDLLMQIIGTIVKVSMDL